MARGGKRPGAGRKKGSGGKPLRATVYRQEMLARAAAEGISPLEVMISAMRNAWEAGQVEEAVQHAVHAAPYVHPRLAATEMRVNDQRSERELTDAELDAIILAESVPRIEGPADSEGESGSLH